MVSRAEVFDRNRPLLFSIAYRMTGSVMEDAVQEAYLRWQRASKDEVRSPSAYLSKVVTRLCIDRLRSARVRREQYVGDARRANARGNPVADYLGATRIAPSEIRPSTLLLRSD